MKVRDDMNFVNCFSLRREPAAMQWSDGPRQFLVGLIHDVCTHSVGRGGSEGKRVG